jgi:hypothetical protein
MGDVIPFRRREQKRVFVDSQSRSSKELRHRLTHEEIMAKAKAKFDEAKKNYDEYVKEQEKQTEAFFKLFD